MLISTPDFETPPIEGYGGGGFRIAGRRSEGSILVLPDGAYDWEAASLEEATTDNLAKLIEQASDLELVIIGCGEKMRPLPKALRQILEDADLAVEFMATGPACRTYNILLSEERRIGAALIAVE